MNYQINGDMIVWRWFNKDR